MNRLNAWESYRQIAMQTASRGQLVLMLYDGGIRFLERALTGFQMEDPAESNETIHNNIHRALDIINELDASLNLQAGGELALALRRVYQYLDWRLTQSNLHKEHEGIREAIGRLSVLRDAWAGMLNGQTDPEAATPQPTPALAA